MAFYQIKNYGNNQWLVSESVTNNSYRRYFQCEGADVVILKEALTNQKHNYVIIDDLNFETNTKPWFDRMSYYSFVIISVTTIALITCSVFFTDMIVIATLLAILTCVIIENTLFLLSDIKRATIDLRQIEYTSAKLRRNSLYFQKGSKYSGNQTEKKIEIFEVLFVIGWLLLLKLFFIWQDMFTLQGNVHAYSIFTGAFVILFFSTALNIQLRNSVIFVLSHLTKYRFE